MSIGVPGYMLPAAAILPAGRTLVGRPMASTLITRHAVRGTMHSVLERGAGQAVPPMATPSTSSTVMTNAQNQLVDQSGRVLIDAYGNPIQYTAPGRGRHMAVSLLVTALVVGIPAYLGSYFGARNAVRG